MNIKDEQSREPGQAPLAKGISRKMLVVMVAMLAVILVPAAAFSLETCKLVITATNMDTESIATCQLSLHAPGYATSIVSLDPGESRVWTYSLKPGNYQVYMYYWFDGLDYSMGSFYEDFTLFLFETEEFDIEAEKWY